MRIFILLIFFVSGLEAAVPPWGINKQTLLVKHAQEWEKDLKQYPSFTSSLLVEEVVKLFPNQRVPIFAYGSLLYPKSALKTISQTSIDTYRLAVAYGYQRAFNYKASLAKKTTSKSDVAMLNLFPTNLFDVVNGVLMWVAQDDLKKLIQRETGYHLTPVIVSDWEQGLNPNNVQPDFWIAYVFIAPSGSSYSHSKINPYPPYANAARLGAERYGDAFFTFWLETTFLADQITPFASWLKNPAINCNRESLCK